MPCAGHSRMHGRRDQRRVRGGVAVADDRDPFLGGVQGIHRRLDTRVLPRRRPAPLRPRLDGGDGIDRLQRLARRRWGVLRLPDVFRDLTGDSFVRFLLRLRGDRLKLALGGDDGAGGGRQALREVREVVVIRYQSRFRHRPAGCHGTRCGASVLRVDLGPVIEQRATIRLDLVIDANRLASGGGGGA